MRKTGKAAWRVDLGQASAPIIANGLLMASGDANPLRRWRARRGDPGKLGQQ